MVKRYRLGNTGHGAYMIPNDSPVYDKARPAEYVTVEAYDESEQLRKECADALAGVILENVEAEKRIKELEADRQYLVDKAGEHAISLRWIPVTERPPDKDTSVFVLDKWNDASSSLYNGTEFVYVVNGCEYPEQGITHWMPQPPMPENT